MSSPYTRHRVSELGGDLHDCHCFAFVGHLVHVLLYKTDVCCVAVAIVDERRSYMLEYIVPATVILPRQIRRPRRRQ